MDRLTRVVPSAEWCLSEQLGARVARLLEPPAPKILLEQTLAQAAKAASLGLVRLAWKQSCERPGHFRVEAQLPLAEVTFDQFFNGRSGYRAQFYISPEEGILYNRDVVVGLWSAVRTAYETSPLEIALSLLERSLFAPHAKVWVFEEKDAFDEAAVETINPKRWVANGATRGRKAPLPAHRMVDLKGAFIHQVTGDIFVDELKLDRAWDIFRKGYT